MRNIAKMDLDFIQKPRDMVYAWPKHRKNRYRDSVYLIFYLLNIWSLSCTG
jgi:hypothetical protein